MHTVTIIRLLLLPVVPASLSVSSYEQTKIRMDSIFERPLPMRLQRVLAVWGKMSGVKAA